MGINDFCKKKHKKLRNDDGDDEKEEKTGHNMKNEWEVGNGHVVVLYYLDHI